MLSICARELTILKQLCCLSLALAQHRSLYHAWPLRLPSTYMSCVGALPQATHNQYKAGAEQRQAELATAAREARSELEAAQRVRHEAEQRAQKLQEQLDAEQTAQKVCWRT